MEEERLTAQSPHSATETRPVDTVHKNWCQWPQQQEQATGGRTGTTPAAATGTPPAIAAQNSLDRIGRIPEQDAFTAEDHQLVLSPIPLANSKFMAVVVNQQEDWPPPLMLDVDHPTNCSPDNVKVSIDATPQRLPDNPSDDEDDNNNEGRRDLNDSVASQGSLGEEEMERMTEELGATSLEFIRRLRGAAFRRKRDLTRSRDSLAVKELEHRRALAAAASKAAQEEAQQRRQSEPVLLSAGMPAHFNARQTSWFHAKPLPKTTGVQGSGGLSGVPKVAKRPTTVPCSPLLGPRRPKRNDLHHSKEVEQGDTKDEDSSESPSPPRNQCQFRALPLPRTTGDEGRAGLSGVPKVPKRLTTVAQSPLLGFRRKPAPNQEPRFSIGNAMGGIPKISKRPTTVPRSPLLGYRRRQSTPTFVNDLIATGEANAERRSNGSGASSGTLVGLRVLDNKVRRRCLASTLEHTKDLPMPGIEPYHPHSTARAAQRASFEARKTLNEQERQRNQSLERRKQVKVLKRHLKALRMSL